jgi:hypothetical protein
MSGLLGKVCGQQFGSTPLSPFLTGFGVYAIGPGVRSAATHASLPSSAPDYETPCVLEM